MHPADIFILAVVAFSIWKGFRRGLVREAIALFGWVAGIILAVNGYEALAPVFEPFIATPSLRLATAFLAICLGVVVTTFLIGQLIRGMMSALAIGPTDHLFGGLFGLARGALIVVLAVGVLGRFFQKDPWWQEAALPAAVMPYAPAALSFTEQVRAQVKNLPRIQIQTAKPDH